MSDARFQFDVEAVIGDDHPFELTFYIKDPVTGVKTPEPVDDRNWFYTVKNSVNDADADAVVVLNPADFSTSPDGNTELNPGDVNNVLTFWLPSETSSLMKAKTYVHDLQSVDMIDGRVFTRGLGTLTMVKDVTERTA